MVDDAVGVIFAPLAEFVGTILLAILYAIIWVAYYLVRALFYSAYMSEHSKGVARIAYISSFVLCLYLIVAFLRGFIPALASPEMSVFFSGYLVLAAAIFVTVSVIVPYVINDLDKQSNQPTPPDEENQHSTLGIPTAPVPKLVIVFLVIVIFIGALSTWSETTRVPTMKERFCDKYRIELSPKMAERTTKGIEFLESKFNRDIKSKIPCKSADNPE